MKYEFGKESVEVSDICENIKRMRFEIKYLVFGLVKLYKMLKVLDNKMKAESNVRMQITVAFYVVTTAFCLVSNLILNYLLFTRKYMKIKYIFTACIAIAYVIICV